MTFDAFLSLGQSGPTCTSHQRRKQLSSPETLQGGPMLQIVGAQRTGNTQSEPDPAVHNTQSEP